MFVFCFLLRYFKITVNCRPMRGCSFLTGIPSFLCSENYDDDEYYCYLHYYYYYHFHFYIFFIFFIFFCLTGWCFVSSSGLGGSQNDFLGIVGAILSTFYIPVVLPVSQPLALKHLTFVGKIRLKWENIKINLYKVPKQWYRHEIRRKIVPFLFLF